MESSIQSKEATVEHLSRNLYRARIDLPGVHDSKMYVLVWAVTPEEAKKTYEGEVLPNLPIGTITSPFRKWNDTREGDSK